MKHYFYSYIRVSSTQSLLGNTVFEGTLPELMKDANSKDQIVISFQEISKVEYEELKKLTNTWEIIL